MIAWKRGKKDKLATCDRTTWESKDGQFRIEAHVQRLGGLRNAYYAFGLFGENFQILGIKTKQETAEKLCIAEAIRRERVSESPQRKPARRKRA